MQITFLFDELPLIREGGAVAIRIAGSAEITYDENGNWRIEQIALDADNDKAGHLFRTCALNLEFQKFGPLWQMIEAALIREHRDAIIDSIVGDQPYSDPNDEHRLTARCLGVGRFAGAW